MGEGLGGGFLKQNKKIQKMTFKKYKSHKIVEATKIVSYEEAFDDTNNLLYYILTDNEHNIHEASANLFARGKPKDDYFYLVKYDDNYISWSPKEAFENGYIETQDNTDTPTTEGIKGYTPVSLDAKHEVNINKDLEEIILQRIEYLQNKGADPRNLAIAKTYIEEAFMRLNRGIFKPARIELSKAVIDNNKKFIPSAEAEIA